MISKNRIAEAKKLIQTAAKENKVVIPDDHLDTLIRPETKPSDTNEKKATILDIFKHSNLRKRSLIIFFDW